MVGRRTIGGMNLDTVEPRSDGVSSRLSEQLNIFVNFLHCEWTRLAPSIINSSRRCYIAA